MFTGLIESLGRVERIEPDGAGGRRLRVQAPFAAQLTIGESVAVSGACLTVVTRDGEGFDVQVSPETLAKTTFADLKPDDGVNLERSLQLGDRLGGHLVQGHVDGVGKVVERMHHGEWETMWFSGPEALIAPMVSKGSVAVDGVSLTLVEVERERFSVALIPHTLEMTTLGSRQPGDPVNIETDILAKYVEKLLARNGE